MFYGSADKTSYNIFLLFGTTFGKKEMRIVYIWFVRFGQPRIQGLPARLN